MKFNFNYKGKNVDLDVEECKTMWQKMKGLMFRKKSKPLLFYFSKKTNEPIHSFFCKPFIAIWFGEGRVVDVKVVKGWRFSIKPKEKFDKLLEILLSDVTLKEFLDGENL